MGLSAEMEEALLGLESAGTEFDAIDEELEQLTKKLTFFSSSPSFPTAASTEAVQECEQHINAHEKAINRPLSHFNKVLSRHECPKSLNVATASPAVLQSIDELVRVHLCETGYAAVGEAMQRESPGHALGNDLLLDSYGYESYINRSLYHITGGEAGTPQPVAAARKVSSTIERELGEAEALLYTRNNDMRSEHANDGDPAAERNTAAAALKARELLDRHKHLVSPQHSLVSGTEEKAWQQSQKAEFEFLKSLRHGLSAALTFLKTLDGQVDADKLAEFSGKLITADVGSADADVREFLLLLRTVLLNRARGEPASGDVPPTDLKLLTNISAQAQQKYLVPLQTASWRGSEELPVEIELPPSNDFHPIFVCPVTKEQASTGELAMLPCGHLLSHDAVKKILLTSEKCPYCPAVFCAHSVTRVRLPRSIEEAFAATSRTGAPML